MEPALTWLDLTVRDREKMQRVLDLFSEQGTVDEMGLGTLRDALSDALFPGTSSIQTRLRYVLFIPWLYQRLAPRVRSGEIMDVSRAARDAETGLIGPLLDSDDTQGVIGSMARSRLSRLPSEVYWGAMVRWRVFSHSKSQSWLHTHFESLAHGISETGRPDDPGIVWSRQPIWHPRLPPAPKGFPWKASFDLAAEEADFIRGRLEEQCGGTLLAWLARAGSATPAESFWEDPAALGANRKIASTVELARRFSLHVEGIPLLYNLVLAEHYARQHGDDQGLISDYQTELDEWAARERSEAPFGPRALWTFVAEQDGRLVEPQRRFVESWTRRVTAIGPAAVASDAFLKNLVEHRELQLKGPRARLANAGRLLDWSCRGRVGVGRMDFRWFRVRQLLTDLHRGLAA
ncbi:MAG: DUF6361 family protein [Gammaproteobacteria bacterium]|nr:DUF6361 family protein [Gammaproteobacteria bacterium]